MVGKGRGQLPPSHTGVHSEEEYRNSALFTFLVVTTKATLRGRVYSGRCLEMSPELRKLNSGSHKGSDAISDLVCECDQLLPIPAALTSWL